MASPERMLETIGLKKGKMRTFVTTPAGHYVDKDGKYVHSSQRPTDLVDIEPLHPVSIDPLTGEERVLEIFL